MSTWIWQQPDWPNFSFDAHAIGLSLQDAAQAIGRLHGQLEVLDDADRERAALLALVKDVEGSSAIEGEYPNVEAVRCLLATRLGVDVGDAYLEDRSVDGVVDMTLDAARNSEEPLTIPRLQAWQAALFPSERSGRRAIRVAQWRDDSDGVMRVVSGPAGRHRIHFEAPPAEVLDAELDRFVRWAETPSRIPTLVKAALAHLWLVTLHPFDDGNGRVARAVGDLMLSRAGGRRERYYSLSAQIALERTAYYEILEDTQRGGLDVTGWLQWFLECLLRAVQRSTLEVEGIVAKAMFWRRIANVPLTSRQVKGLKELLEEPKQLVTNRTWASVTGTSSDTAWRDLRALVGLRVLERTSTNGRAAAYRLRGVAAP